MILMEVKKKLIALSEALRMMKNVAKEDAAS